MGEVGPFLQVAHRLVTHAELGVIQVLYELPDPLRIGCVCRPHPLAQEPHCLVGMIEQRVHGAIGFVRVGAGEILPQCLPVSGAQKRRFGILMFLRSVSESERQRQEAQADRDSLACKLTHDFPQK